MHHLPSRHHVIVEHRGAMGVWAAGTDAARLLGLKDVSSIRYRAGKDQESLPLHKRVYREEVYRPRGGAEFMYFIPLAAIEHMMPKHRCWDAPSCINGASSLPSTCLSARLRRNRQNSVRCTAPMIGEVRTACCSGECPPCTHPTNRHAGT